MRRLQDSILYLVIQLTILFNIERLDVNGTSPINLSTTIYLLTTIAVITTLSVKWIRKMRPAVLGLMWAIVFIIVKFTTTSQHPLLGGIYTYLTFTEFAMFLLAVYLTHNVTLNFDELEQAIKNFAFANNSRIKRTPESQEKINAEIYRSRRFQRDLSVIVLEQDMSKARLENNKVVQEAQRTMMEHYISAMLAREVYAQLRQTDLLIEHDKDGKLIIVSPDTDEVGAQKLIDRLNTLAQDGAFSIKFGTATFPDNGLTFDQLLRHAEVSLHQVDTPLSIEEEVKKDHVLPIN